MRNVCRWVDKAILGFPSAVLNSEMGHDACHLDEKINKRHPNSSIYFFHVGESYIRYRTLGYL